jgi:oxidase EvaA
MARATAPTLVPRTGPPVSSWLAAEMSRPDGGGAARVLRWMAARTRAHDYRIDLIPFGELDQWSFDPATGNLRHQSGRFFSVEGLRVTVEDTSAPGPPRSWCQPILNQPEVGILGLLVKDFDGIPHVLMQAKMEPGNRNLVQLSPSVQATRSNYTRVHGGTPVRYLEYFREPGRGRVLADVLQSEQGSWFYRKVNRNMIVEISDDVEPHEDFRWLSLGEVGDLLRMDNIVSMDARSTLSCLPVRRAEAGALHTDAELLFWFSDMRSRYCVQADRMPLAQVPEWHRTGTAIEHEQGLYFRIVATSVGAASREVAAWSQPILQPAGTGVVCFLTCQVDGVTHVLANARPEAGSAYSVELAPTVQCDPANHGHRPASERPRFLDLVLSAAPARIGYQSVQSEEGGRFRHAETRYMLVEAGEAFTPPPEYRWVTPGQLAMLVRHGNYLNVEARTLLAVLNATRAGPAQSRAGAGGPAESRP